MASYYCVKRPGECDGTCSVCPISPPEQYEFDFMKDTEHDDVNQPDHYTMGNIEVFDFIEAWELSFAEGNVIKYTVRAPYKGSKVKDLKKARWYLDRLIEEAEKEAS